MTPGRISLRHLFSKMNAKIIAWYVGIALLLVSALMIVSGIIAFHTPGDASRTPLLFSAFLTGIVGAYPFIFIRNGSHKLNFREANCIVVVSWVFCCFFGMLPYLFYGEDFSFVNALFELGAFNYGDTPVQLGALNWNPRSYIPLLPLVNFVMKKDADE